jgi:hypothetical protein
MRAVMVAIALALMLPVCAEAGGRSGGRSHASSGGKSHAHHHHHSGGAVFIGGGFYYGYPYYPYPYGVPLYAPMPADPYWYYCRAANAYYPYVQSCPGGWERYLPGTPLG